MMPGFNDKIFSVSEITSLIKEVLETGFREVRISGEISNCRPSSTGHLYFTLKDKDAMISAVMFRGRYSALPFKPSDGMLVNVTGNISVYALRGSYQIICDSIEKAGEGDILAMLEKRKRKLAEEGLFDRELKKPLPVFPSKIAVITSPTGAAVKDILRVTRRRNPGLDIVILPAPVQGEEAAEKIAAQIRYADRHRMADVIITGRGGGSLEDLLPFSEECVVRAIAESDTPVISAVGHEIDTSLSDFAADVSAPTPSAAAEIVSSGRDDILRRIQTISDNLISEIGNRNERIRLMLERYTGKNIEETFFIMIQPVLARFDDLKEGLLNSFSRTVTEKRYQLDSALRELKAVSPQSILERGFAIVTDAESGKTILSADEAEACCNAAIRFHDGTVSATLNEKLPEGDER